MEVAVLAFLALSLQFGLLGRVAHVVRINRAVLSSTLGGSGLFGEITLLLALSGRDSRIMSVRFENASSAKKKIR